MTKPLAVILSEAKDLSRTYRQSPVRASQKSHSSAKTRRLRRQKKERKSVTRRAAARRVTLFLSFGVGWGTHSATFEKPCPFLSAFQSCLILLRVQVLN